MKQAKLKLAMMIGVWTVFWWCLGVYAGRDTVPVRVVRVPANMACELGPTAGEVLCHVAEVRP